MWSVASIWGHIQADSSSAARCRGQITVNIGVMSDLGPWNHVMPSHGSTRGTIWQDSLGKGTIIPAASKIRRIGIIWWAVGSMTPVTWWKLLVYVCVCVCRHVCVCVCVCVCMLYVLSLSRFQLFVTPWTVAHEVSLSMGFPRQEYWNGLLFFSSVSPALAGRFFTTSTTWKYTNREKVWRKLLNFCLN